MKIAQLIFVFSTIFLNCCTIHGNIEKIGLHMPGVRPKKDDSYICTSLKLPPGDSYVVKYEPEAHKETAHHMLLFGCDEPGRAGVKAWNCGDRGSGTCKGSESILFGWARDATSLNLPKDVGFRVGGETKIQYLTLQIHYAHAIKAKYYDRSGLTLHLTTVPQPNLASIYLLVAMSAYIPPHSKGIHVDIACKYNSDQEINAFAFRTHAHDLGRVITGYRVRNNTWTLLGKGDPHAPQAFYPMENVTIIKKGDILAARCTFDSSRSRVTRIGGTASDEMCNFYMMYYRDASSETAVPDVCDDQYTYESLYDSFPNGSDVALHSASGHHHHHGHHSMHDGGAGEENANEITDIAPVSDEPGTSQGITTSSGNENVKNDVIPNVDDDRESTTGNPVQETTKSPRVQTSRSVTDDVASDVTTSTSVSEQTTAPSDVVPNPSTRLNLKVSTDSSFERRRTTRSTEESKFMPTDKITWSNGEKESGTGKTSKNIDYFDKTSLNNGRQLSTEKTSKNIDYFDKTSLNNGRQLSTEKPTGNGEYLDETTSSDSGQPSRARPTERNDRTEFNVSVVDAWPSGVTEGLGQVTGLAVDSAGRLFVFHRSERTWDYITFNMDNTFHDAQARGPIHGATILILDGVSGKVLEKHGQDMFYLPHGLTIDHQDNLWVTDVGRHQVLKFQRGEFKSPSLVLGEMLAPGSDYKHFCKPTDVAVEKTGVFYVSDGYCNGRIMKFSSEGTLLKVWGRHSLQENPPTNTFDIPHSLTLDEKRNMLYVADRENGRIQCFDLEGKFHKEISSPKFGGLVFAVNYNKLDDVLYAVNSGDKTKVQGFTINPGTGKIIASWSPHGQGFSQPHDIVSNGSIIYVAEIGPNKVWKLEHIRAVTSKDQNFARGLNAAVLDPNPSKASDGTDTVSDDTSREKPEASNRPGLVILTILSVPVLILLVVGVVSKITRRRRSLPKYDMMDASLGNNYSVSRNWCSSMNCCDKQYRNMEELYLMDSDSDLEIYPDVHVDRK